MKKLFLTSVAALFLATGAVRAGDDQKFPRVRILPPVEFDHPFEGDLKLIRYATEEEVIKACNRKRIACAKPDGKSCTVIMLDDKALQAWMWMYGNPDDLYRHEVGHCNGWPNDHPGMRIGED
jgi:hypothetical protein